MNSNVLEEKPAIIEIKETMRKSYYASIFCEVFGVFLLVITTIAIVMISKTAENEFQKTAGTLILLFFDLVMIGFLIYVGFKMRGGRKVRSFVIDENTITFKTPNKPTFSVNLDSFNTVEVSRISKEKALDFVLDEIMWIHSRTIYYRFHFIEATKSYIVESQKDYSRKGLNKIRAALEQYCQVHGKSYIFKK